MTEKPEKKKLQEKIRTLEAKVKSLLEKNRSLQDKLTCCRMIFENAGDGISVYENFHENRHANLADCNPAYAKMAGRTREELLREGNICKFMQSQGFDEESGNIQEKMKNAQPFEGVYSWIRPDGKENYTQYHAVPIKDSDGIRVVSTERDITLSRKAEKALQEREKWAWTLLNATQDAALLLKPEGTILALNKHAEKRLAREGQDIVSMNGYDLLPSKLAKKLRSFNDTAVRMKSALQFRDENQGTIFHHHVYPVMDDGGNVEMLAVYAREITDKTGANKELKEKEELYRCLVDALPQCMFQLDKNHTIQFVNNNLLEMANLTLEECMGKTAYDFFPLPLADKYMEEDRWVLKTGEIFHGIQQVVMPHMGEIRDIEITKFPVRDPEGNITGIQALFWDITDKKEMAQSLTESELRYSTMMEISPDPVFIVGDTNFHILFANNAAVNLMRAQDADALIGTQLIDNIDPGIFSAPKNRQCMKYSRVKNPVFTCTLRDFSGGMRMLETTMGKVVYKNENAWILMVKDITERWIAEKALTESEEKYRVLIENTNEGVAVLQNEYLRFLNSSFKHMTGYDEKELTTQKAIHFVQEDHRKHVSNTVKKYIKGETQDEYITMQVIVKNKKNIWVRVNLAKSNWEGKPALVVFMQDINEIKAFQDSLTKSLKEKEVLLREVHHRVKNNLQVISGMLYLSGAKIDIPEAVEALHEARHRIHNLALIHTQLYESDEFDRIDIQTHISRLVQNLSMVYKKEGRMIVHNISPCDVKLSLTQAIPCALVLNEIVSNSFKYGFTGLETGKIEISCKRLDNNMVSFRVWDNGVGIPEDIDINSDKSVGLKLVRDIIVRQLKGDIRINRENGTEVEFEFSIL